MILQNYFEELSIVSPEFGVPEFVLGIPQNLLHGLPLIILNQIYLTASFVKVIQPLSRRVP